MEPINGIEPSTSSLPRKCSATELYGHYMINELKIISKAVEIKWSGKRDSNPQLSAWKADALAIELFPHGGGRRIRTFEGITNRFTVCPLWPLGNSTI
jgi:hypothetical protein